MRNKFSAWVLAFLLVACNSQPVKFSGQTAFSQVQAQMKLGARPTGSEAGRATGDYILAELRKSGWAMEEQRFDYKGTGIRNIIGRKGSGPVVILGAHYDTRRRADRDKTRPTDPVPGALAVGPSLGTRSGWSPALADDAERVGLGDIRSWLDRAG